MFESSANASLGGNCVVDVDECASSPCSNGATCSESEGMGTVTIGSWTSDAEFFDIVPVHTYRCTCVAGFVNGVCEYDFISELIDECNVTDRKDSMLVGAGNCDVDVDECVSSPCSNGATCSESSTEAAVSLHAHQCTCVAGFANGWCEYDFHLGVQCRVHDV